MMPPALILLLIVHQFITAIDSEVVDLPAYGLNALPENTNTDSINEIVSTENNDGRSEEQSSQEDTIPFVRTGHDQTEVEFRHPISSVNIDYSRNVIILKFRKDPPQQRMRLNPEETEQRKAFEHNFMRFGRASGDFMRFGKRVSEKLPTVNSIDYGVDEKNPKQRFERSQQGLRDSRGDNFMRFGRSQQDFMRFGRAPSQDFMRFGRGGSQDFMRFGRGSQDFMRFGRSGPNDFMRFGRGGPNDFMRFGRVPAADYMRFGRAPADDYMRFGRAPADDYMRFGRAPADDYMRFGRAPAADFIRFGRAPAADFMRFGRNQKPNSYVDKNFMRFGRPDNFMRFGRTPQKTGETSGNNFMRFGKSIDKADKLENQTKPLLQKSDIKEAAKWLQENEKDEGEGESNPMDKAISVLFGKQTDPNQQQSPHQSLESINDDIDEDTQNSAMEQLQE